MKNKNIPVSKQQKRLSDLYNGELNVKIEGYYVDILLENNIICEYDGSGHDLCVKNGSVTKRKFNKKEASREKIIISRGYRIFRIISKYDILPDDIELLKIKDRALEVLKNKVLYKYNLDNKVENLFDFNEIK